MGENEWTSLRKYNTLAIWEQYVVKDNLRLKERYMLVILRRKSPIYWKSAN
jgi:hypothetical protein